MIATAVLLSLNVVMQSRFISTLSPRLQALAIQQDSTRAAITRVTSYLGSCKTEIVSQHLREGTDRLRVGRCVFSVKVE